VFQSGNAGRELKAQQGAQSKDMFGVTAAIGVVAVRGDLTLMVEQRVKNVQRFARGGRDQLAVKGAVAVREMRVDLEPGLLVSAAAPTRVYPAREANVE
jgi:hypothetical protein